MASPESIRGDFDNLTLNLDGEKYRLEKRGEEFWVQIPNPDRKLGRASTTDPANVDRRISLVTGSHHMQAYWTDNQHGNQQFSLPFTYLFEQARWVPRRTVFLMNPSSTNWAQIWNLGCIDCHSTAGQPRKDPGESAAFQSRVAELGIACESCHGPAGKHVALNSDPLRRYKLHRGAIGDVQIVNPARLASKRSSEVCGRCHSVHAPIDEQQWLDHGDNFHPGEELEPKVHVVSNPRSKELRQSCFWSDGMIRVSGREYNGLLKSPCFQKGELSCLSCHSMHSSSPTNQLAAGMVSNAACIQCHTSMAARLEEHTHHKAGSSGSLCYNCHMPYTSYGLLKALRSHQISSPNVRASLQTGRPNACNLCHLDKTLAWTGDRLTAWFNQPKEELDDKERTTAASLLWSLQGDAGQRALMAWHMGWSEARETSQESWLPPYLALLMQDDYPAVRYIAGRSLKRIRGFENFSYDYLLPRPSELYAKEVFSAWAKGFTPSPNPELLINPDGKLHETKLRELLAAQNKRVVELSE